METFHRNLLHTIIRYIQRKIRNWKIGRATNSIPATGRAQALAGDRPEPVTAAMKGETRKRIVCRYVCQNQDRNFGDMRIAKAQRIKDGLVEFHQLVLADQMRATEMPHQLPQTGAHRDVGEDQHRNGKQEPSVRGDIVKERYFGAAKD